MAFDAGFIKAVTYEMSKHIINSRIEKIFQPTKESVILILRVDKKHDLNGNGHKLLIDVGSANPRILLTHSSIENPKVPPMLCMLLRKHLTGAKIISVKQLDFDRVIEIEFETKDELGFLSKKYLYAEIMGKFSNLIFCDSQKKIISAVKTNDLSTDSKRPVLQGIKYTAPPKQDGKIAPFEDNFEDFIESYKKNNASVYKFIMSRYCGISPLIAREIEYMVGSDRDKLWGELLKLSECLNKNNFSPILLKKNDGTPLEYSFMPIYQYGSEAVMIECDSFGKLTEDFFEERARVERIHQKASDILKLLTNAETRLNKKIIIQKNDLQNCQDKLKYKLYGDIITANIYLLSRGMTRASLRYWTEFGEKTAEIELDSRLTPAQNAQKYYKKYNKCKSAEINLTKQIEIANRELDYLNTVFDALNKSETENDLLEIRRELFESGYASKMKSYTGVKITAPKPMEFKTSGGYTVFCGKNNSQNDYLTHKLAAKNDIWFHIKGYAGSHAVMICNGEEPSAEDFTEAAIIAAVYSKAPRGQKAEVDYTKIKNIKKPPASKPGFVTFSSNYSAYVMPDPQIADRLRVVRK